MRTYDISEVKLRIRHVPFGGSNGVTRSATVAVTFVWANHIQTSITFAQSVLGEFVRLCELHCSPHV